MMDIPASRRHKDNKIPKEFMPMSTTPETLDHNSSNNTKNQRGSNLQTKVKSTAVVKVLSNCTAEQAKSFTNW
jgi:hypothetical protein